MFTCEKCAFWERADTEKRPNPENEALNFLYPFGQCNCPKSIYEYEEDLDRSLLKQTENLIYFDDKCFGVGFKTGEKFGCIHFVGPKYH